MIRNATEITSKAVSGKFRSVQQTTKNGAELANECGIDPSGQISERTGISSNCICAVTRETLSVGTSLSARVTFPEKVSGGQPVLLRWPCSLVNNPVGDFLHRRSSAAPPESAAPRHSFPLLNCQFCARYQAAPVTAEG